MSTDERFQGVEHQFNAVNGRHGTLRERLERANSETQDKTRSRFTKEDGEKLAARIKELYDLQMLLERQLIERVTNVQLKLIALEANGGNQQEISLLRAEVQRLHAYQVQQPRSGYSSGGGPSEGGAVANTVPTYLPPISQHR